MKEKRQGIKFLVWMLVIFGGVWGIIYGQEGQEGQEAGDNKDKGGRINLILDDESVETRELLGDTVSRSLYKVVLSTFEQSGEWYTLMPNDMGYIASKMQKGAPLALAKKEDQEIQVPASEVSSNEQGSKRPPRFRKENGKYQSKYYVPYQDNRQYILGVKASFNKRGSSWFGVYPYRNIRMEGLVKSFEVWVVGRQKNHTLHILVDDIYGNEQMISLGSLNFLGWKRMYVNVPSHIKQYDYDFSHTRGLLFKGFVVKTEPRETRGNYYIYFDNFSAEVSRFWEEYQDEKDPIDQW